MRPGKCGCDRGRRGLHRDEPLVREHRLDDFAGAAATRHDHPVRLLADDEAFLREIREHGLARRIAIEAAVLLGRVGVDRRVEVEDGDRLQAVALAELPVVEVVRRRDLHATGAEGFVDVGVGDDGNRAAGERQHDRAADEARVALVVGIHRHRDVAQHRLGPRGGDDDVDSTGRARVAYLPDRSLLLLVLDLEVGDRRAERRIPVDETLAAVDEAVLEQPDERFDHRGGQPGVHREPLARPVAGRAESSHLVRDRPAGCLFPRPDALRELLAAKVPPRLALRLQLLLDDDLRGDAGVIGAELPQRVVAAHPVVADQHVHQRHLERMTHVERAGDVRRGQLDAEGGSARRVARLEVAARFPQRIPLRLDGVGFEAFGEFHDASCSPREGLAKAGNYTRIAGTPPGGIRSGAGRPRARTGEAAVRPG